MKALSQGFTKLSRLQASPHALGQMLAGPPASGYLMYKTYLCDRGI